MKKEVLLGAYLFLSYFFGLSLYGQDRIGTDSIVSTLLETYQNAPGEMLYLQLVKIFTRRVKTFGLRLIK